MLCVSHSAWLRASGRAFRTRACTYICTVHTYIHAPSTRQRSSGRAPHARAATQLKYECKRPIHYLVVIIFGCCLRRAAADSGRAPARPAPAPRAAAGSPGAAKGHGELAAQLEELRAAKEVLEKEKDL